MPFALVPPLKFSHCCIRTGAQSSHATTCCYALAMTEEGALPHLHPCSCCYPKPLRKPLRVCSRATLSASWSQVYGSPHCRRHQVGGEATAKSWHGGWEALLRLEASMLAATISRGQEVQGGTLWGQLDCNTASS